MTAILRKRKIEDVVPFKNASRVNRQLSLQEAFQCIDAVVLAQVTISGSCCETTVMHHDLFSDTKRHFSSRLINYDKHNNTF